MMPLRFSSRKNSAPSTSKAAEGGKGKAVSAKPVVAKNEGSSASHADQAAFASAKRRGLLGSYRPKSSSKSKRHSQQQQQQQRPTAYQLPQPQQSQPQRSTAQQKNQQQQQPRRRPLEAAAGPAPSNTRCDNAPQSQGQPGLSRRPAAPPQGQQRQQPRRPAAPQAAVDDRRRSSNPAVAGQRHGKPSSASDDRRRHSSGTSPGAGAVPASSITPAIRSAKNTSKLHAMISADKQAQAEKVSKINKEAEACGQTMVNSIGNTISTGQVSTFTYITSTTTMTNATSMTRGTARPNKGSRPYKGREKKNSSSRMMPITEGGMQPINEGLGGMQPISESMQPISENGSEHTPRDSSRSNSSDDVSFCQPCIYVSSPASSKTSPGSDRTPKKSNQEKDRTSRKISNASYGPVPFGQVQGGRAHDQSHGRRQVVPTANGRGLEPPSPTGHKVSQSLHNPSMSNIERRGSGDLTSQSLHNTNTNYGRRGSADMISQFTNNPNISGRRGSGDLLSQSKNIQNNTRRGSGDLLSRFKNGLRKPRSECFSQSMDNLDRPSMEGAPPQGVVPRRPSFDGMTGGLPAPQSVPTQKPSGGGGGCLVMQAMEGRRRQNAPIEPGRPSVGADPVLQDYARRHSNDHAHGGALRQQQAAPATNQRHTYQRGDTLVDRSHFLPFRSSTQAGTLLTELPLNSPLFVKRSNRQWTYAALVGRMKATDGEMTVVVALDSKRKVKKILEASKWERCLRLVNDELVAGASASNSRMMDRGVQKKVRALSTDSFLKSAAARSAARGSKPQAVPTAAPASTATTAAPNAASVRANPRLGRTNNDAGRRVRSLSSDSLMSLHDEAEQSKPISLDDVRRAAAGFTMPGSEDNLSSSSPALMAVQRAHERSSGAVTTNLSSSEDFASSTAFTKAPVASSKDDPALLAIQRAHDRSMNRSFSDVESGHRRVSWHEPSPNNMGVRSPGGAASKNGASGHTSPHKESKIPAATIANNLRPVAMRRNLSADAITMMDAPSVVSSMAPLSHTSGNTAIPSLASTYASYNSGSRGSGGSAKPVMVATKAPSVSGSTKQLSSSNGGRNSTPATRAGEPSLDPESPNTVTVNLNARTFSGSRRDRMRPKSKQGTARRGSAGSLMQLAPLAECTQTSESKEVSCDATSAPSSGLDTSSSNNKNTKSGYSNGENGLWKSSSPSDDAPSSCPGRYERERVDVAKGRAVAPPPYATESTNVSSPGSSSVGSGRTKQRLRGVDP